MMIVGNADLEPEAERRISLADLVVRFNDCRSAGPDGGRTDIVAVCNTGRPGKRMTEEPGWRQNPCVALASEIWSIRHPAKFSEMQTALALSHPDLDDFCDDYSPAFGAICFATGKTHYVVPRQTHERLDEELAAFSPAPYVVPSTGLIVIAELLWNRAEPGDSLAITGFGHDGWEWHPWDAERQWVDARHAEGRLSRLDDLSSRRSASGA